ncbi:MAG: hypothetical protein RJA09_1781 [Pseudomonadota bacterium]
MTQPRTVHTAPLMGSAPHSTPIRWGALALAASLASGCAMLEEDKVDYKSATRTNSLEIPPDLTQLSRESRYVVPGSVVTASGYQISQPAKSVPTAASQVGDVRIERAGTQRWLVVDRAPDKLWGPVRDFWQESGFFLTVDQQNLGLMETDWAENRAKLPQDIIRQTLGKFLDNLYSTGERDKFRTRMERNANGGTEIFISHRGMIEVYSNEKKDQTMWQPRPTDTDLEAEFLRRMMVKLGVTEEQSKALLASGASQPKSRLVGTGAQQNVQVEEDFDRAWRRVGLALDRTGFTVEDRDRSQGVYFVRYVAPDANTAAAAKPGFFGRLFGTSKPKEATPVRYRVLVKATGNQSAVSVQNAQGQPDATADAGKILSLLADELK